MRGFVKLIEERLQIKTNNSSSRILLTISEFLKFTPRKPFLNHMDHR